jgi:hypothetical protein
MPEVICLFDMSSFRSRAFGGGSCHFYLMANKSRGRYRYFDCDFAAVLWEAEMGMWDGLFETCVSSLIIKLPFVLNMK